MEASPQFSDRSLSSGRVVSVSGPVVSVLTSTTSRITVGQFLMVGPDTSKAVGVVTKVSLEPIHASNAPVSSSRLHLTLIGEFRASSGGKNGFVRGITNYPAIGDAVRAVSSDELRSIFNASGKDAVSLGRLHQNGALDAYVNVSDMLSKHFAVLGTTGVGKSSAVAVILNQIIHARKDMRIFLLDVHNEYGRCFGSSAQVLSPGNIRLPFWLFNFDEIVDVIFGGRPGFDEEVDLLSEAIPLAKAAYSNFLNSAERLAGKLDTRGIRYTTDIPLPYRIVDLISLLDARMGKLENRSMRMAYHKLISRIEAACNDPRYAFMFENANVGGDTMEEVLSHLFRLPLDGVPISVMQLAGFPSEVVDSVVSVICRMAFDLGVWSDGANPMLIMCEEAHRYMSSDARSSFGPTRRSISRIAKEGRKYNVSLGIVTQRPAELDPTILAQCSTLFVMRLTNDRDQQILESAVSDTSSGLLSLIPSLGTGEAFVFGEGVSLPTRFALSPLDAERLPRSDMSMVDGGVTDRKQASLSAIIERWRGLPQSLDPIQVPSGPLAPALPNARGLDPERYKLLRRPIDETVGSHSTIVR